MSRWSDSPPGGMTRSASLRRPSASPVPSWRPGVAVFSRTDRPRPGRIPHATQPPRGDRARLTRMPRPARAPPPPWLARTASARGPRYGQHLRTVEGARGRGHRPSLFWSSVRPDGPATTDRTAGHRSARLTGMAGYRRQLEENSTWSVSTASRTEHSISRRCGRTSALATGG